MIPVIPNLGFRFVEQAKAKKKKSLCVFVSGTLNFLHLFQKILKQQRILIIYQKRCQTGVMAYEKLSTLHELSNLENHLKKMFSVWLYQSPHHIVVEGLWPTLVYSVGSVHCLCTGLLRPTTAFSHDVVWTSTGPLQHFLFCFLTILFDIFCFVVIVLLQY